VICFLGAGPGDPELITLKALKILKKADVVLYTGSLVPREVLSYCKKDALIEDSQNMSYEEIFSFLKKYQNKTVARVHTGDPTLYSTIAKQIEFLKKENIPFEVISGVSAVFAASASLGIEYTIPGVSQTLILGRIEGKTPNPQKLRELLLCKNSSFVFYLSISLIKDLKKEALKLGYPKNTPCFVVEKASWKDEKVYRGTIDDIADKVSHIKGIALILFGEFLNQREKTSSRLYNF